MAIVNKPGGIIAGVDIPEWNIEDTTTNSRLTIVMDPVKITTGNPNDAIAGTFSLYYDYYDIENGVSTRYTIMEAQNVTLHGMG